MFDEIDPQPLIVRPTLEQLKRDVEICKQAYERSHTYSNALALQKANRALDTFYSDRRKEMKPVDGASGEHDLTDHDIAIDALKHIKKSIETHTIEPEGILLYVWAVAKHAIKSIEVT